MSASKDFRTSETFNQEDIQKEDTEQNSSSRDSAHEELDKTVAKKMQ